MLQVKSRRSAEEVLEQGGCVLHWLANELADGFAGWAAGVWSLPPAVVREVEDIDRKARLVQDRLGYIAATFSRDICYPEGQDTYTAADEQEDPQVQVVAGAAAGAARGGEGPLRRRRALGRRVEPPGG